MGSHHITKYRINLDLMEIMGVCMGQWVVSGQMTSLIQPELIDIIRFCLKIYDLWRHPHLWVDGWVNGWAHVKSLKSNKF